MLTERRPKVCTSEISLIAASVQHVVIAFLYIFGDSFERKAFRAIRISSAFLAKAALAKNFPSNV
jgi:hypothetical protein